MGSSFLLLCPPLPSLRSLSTSRDPWQVRPSPPSAFLMAAVSAAADWRLTSQRGASRCSPLAFCASPSPPPRASRVRRGCDGGSGDASNAISFPLARPPARNLPPSPPPPFSLELPSGGSSHAGPLPTRRPALLAHLAAAVRGASGRRGISLPGGLGWEGRGGERKPHRCDRPSLGRRWPAGPPSPMELPHPPRWGGG